MKKIFVLFTAAILIFVLCACGGFNQELYDKHLSGKTFESDGRVLKFDDENCMTYTYTNRIGNTFKYTYSITDIVEDGDKITMTIVEVKANTDIEKTDDGKEEKVYYNKSDNTIKYYSVTYDFLK